MLKGKWLPLALVVFFLVSRAYIWVFKPPEFSEIIYSYMPYAHLWDSGVRPYLDQWYEYPPATVPLFYVPHLIDKATHGTPWHFNYSNAYRGILLLVDCGLFWLIWKTLRRFNVSSTVFTLGLIYYILATSKANHFIYDTMDLTFAAAMIVGVVAPVIWKGRFDTFFSWFGFFLATALKYVNAPLAPLYALLELPELKLASLKHQPLDWGHLGYELVEYIHQTLKTRGLKLVISVLAAALLVWGAPLALYRSSLQVSFVYHQLRGLQIDSAPAIVVRTLNAFTKSEKAIEVYKNYEISGPLSTQALAISNIVFPLALAAFLLFSVFLIWRSRLQTQTATLLRIWLTFGFILVFMLTAKVLSRPFLLWHVPFVALFPFKNWKWQLTFMTPSLIILVTTLSKAPDWEVGIFPLPLLVGWVRVLCFAYLLGMWLLYSRQLLNKHQAS
jgi:hypothetical protein